MLSRVRIAARMWSNKTGDRLDLFNLVNDSGELNPLEMEGMPH